MLRVLPDLLLLEGTIVLVDSLLQPLPYLGLLSEELGRASQANGA